jgi:hypothetical protein
MKKKFSDYNKAAQWIICRLTYDQCTEFLELSEKSNGTEIQLIVNGQPFDFENIANGIEEAFDSAVEKRAHEVAAELVAEQLVPRGAILNLLWGYSRELDNTRARIDMAINDILHPTRDEE